MRSSPSAWNGASTIKVGALFPHGPGRMPPGALTMLVAIQRRRPSFSVPNRTAVWRYAGMDGRTGRCRAFRAGCNSRPAVALISREARDPAPARHRLIWSKSRADGESPDGRRRSRRRLAWASPLRASSRLADGATETMRRRARLTADHLSWPWPARAGRGQPYLTGPPAEDGSLHGTCALGEELGPRVDARLEAKPVWAGVALLVRSVTHS